MHLINIITFSLVFVFFFQNKYYKVTLRFLSSSLELAGCINVQAYWSNRWQVIEVVEIGGWYLPINNVFVTDKWGRTQNEEGKVWLQADPTRTFGKETELLLDELLVSLFDNWWFKRFSMMIEDGVWRN